MSVLIRVGKQKAILRRGEWVCADPELESLLNARTGAWIRQTGGPPINDRDHEKTVAREIAGQLGARIIRQVRASPRQAAQVYISRRQLDLDFW